jgi:lycopene epsilon-cyclase
LHIRRNHTQAFVGGAGYPPLLFSWHLLSLILTRAVWQDAVCYFKEQQRVRVGRPYGRVCRRSLRAHLLSKCAAAGVSYLEAVVSDASSSATQQASELALADGRTVRCRIAVLASGQTAGKLLQYEDGVPPVAAQTAYGIEAEVEGYSDSYPEDAMLFMDFRRHHTGLYDGTANK